jgi:hypothetical protein
MPIDRTTVHACRAQAGLHNLYAAVREAYELGQHDEVHLTVRAVPGATAGFTFQQIAVVRNTTDDGSPESDDPLPVVHEPAGRFVELLGDLDQATARAAATSNPADVTTMLTIPGEFAEYGPWLRVNPVTLSAWLAAVPPTYYGIPAGPRFHTQYQLTGLDPRSITNANRFTDMLDDLAVERIITSPVAAQLSLDVLAGGPGQSLDVRVQIELGKTNLIVGRHQGLGSLFLPEWEGSTDPALDAVTDSVLATVRTGNRIITDFFNRFDPIA